MVKIAIIDDDKTMLDIIVNKINQMTEIIENSILYTFTSPEDVLKQLEHHKEFDIIISDVEMEKMQGIEFGEIIRSEYPDIFLVFLTAFPHYAVKSYAINAHQYVLKEEMEERLQDVLTDMQNQIQEKRKKYRNIVKGKEIHKVMYSDILYIQKLKGEKYVQYTTLQGEYQERNSLEQILEELANSGFLMIERGFIINVEHIDAVKGRMVLLDNGEMLTISRGRYTEIREQLHVCWREQL